jgi:acetyltransferase
VAVVGATETPGSVGRTLIRNLLGNPFGGPVFPVHPTRATVLGTKAYPGIGAIPQKVDLAVIATPAPTVPKVIEECVGAGVRGAVIVSAGFREFGPAGAALEREVLERARRGSLRVIGPNCLGVMNPLLGLNATFAASIAKPGNVAFLSQSGALCTAILDWSLHELVGFSAFVSTGSMLDVGWGDLIDYFGSDPQTHSILIYMESIGDARSFLSAAREVALDKPIIVIKAGRNEAAAKAAASHTGSMTGSDEVFDAAFRRVGVLRVHNISDLFYMAEVLARQPRPKGPRLTILTNAGGPGVLATDALIEGKGELSALSTGTMEELNKILPPQWSHNNPIDILGDAGPTRYSSALNIAARDENTDGLLVILTPQDMTDPTQTAEALKSHAKIEGKPVLASWMGGASVSAGEDILNLAGIPTFPFPDTAAREFVYMWRYADNLRGLFETPSLAREDGNISRDVAGAIIAEARRDGKTLLSESESKQLLASYGIPTARTELAADVESAARAAESIGYPVVLKLYSKTITHKSDVGGVKLDLINSGDVRRAFAEIQSSVTEKVGKEQFQGVTVQPMISYADSCELIIGSSIDPQFGPVLLFGAGGQLVEVIRDRALALPPLNATLARRMMEQTKIYKALRGARGRKPVDLDAMEHLMVRFSQLVVEQRWIREIDINPLLVSSQGIIALDARVVLFPAQTPEGSLPRAAIRPYPTQYVAPWTTENGTAVVIRPIRPEDEPLLVKFHQTLSERTVHLRYFAPVKLSRRTSHERLSRICFVDYQREIALVAERPGPRGAEILGVARLTKSPGTNEAEMAALISDQWQHQGLGTEMVRRLIQIARDERIGRLTADILADNYEMLNLAEALGFALERMDSSITHAELALE